MPEHRPRILQMGPDPRSVVAWRRQCEACFPRRSPSAMSWRSCRPIEGPRGLRGLGIYCLALARLSVWSLRGRGRIVHIHATVRGSTYRKSLCVLLAKALRRRVVLHVHSGAGDVAEFAASRGRISLALFSRRLLRCRCGASRSLRRRGGAQACIRLIRGRGGAKRGGACASRRREEDPIAQRGSGSPISAASRTRQGRRHDAGGAGDGAGSASRGCG